MLFLYFPTGPVLRHLLLREQQQGPPHNQCHRRDRALVAEPPSLPGAGVQPGQRHFGPWTGNPNPSWLCCRPCWRGPAPLLLKSFSGPCWPGETKPARLMTGREALVEIRKGKPLVCLCVVLIGVCAICCYYLASPLKLSHSETYRTTQAPFP